MPPQPPIQHLVSFSDLALMKPGDTAEIVDDEAHHAVKVKRIAQGDRLALIDGRGLLAPARVLAVSGSRSRPVLLADIESIERFDPITPRVEIFAAPPKGERLDRMIDQLAQLGVAAYRPLVCQRSQRSADSIRADKLGRIAAEASKQCRRAWTMDIGEPISFDSALSDPDSIAADASGEPPPGPGSPQSARPRAVVLIGPEGGWSQPERDRLISAQTPMIRLGPLVLRIEAAACAAAAILLSHATHTQRTPS